MQHQTFGVSSPRILLTTLLLILIFTTGSNNMRASGLLYEDSKRQSIISQVDEDKTSIFKGQGFDKCEIPTLSQMQTWIDESPYRVVNLYIGGSKRSCRNRALTSSYITQLSEQGWKFIPTWVGPQCRYGNISYDLNTAYAQGVSEAEAAVREAASLGLTSSDSSGTIIYYDMEGYTSQHPDCSEPAKKFIEGWTAKLHFTGNMAGLYGSVCASEINIFSAIDPMPDAIWLADATRSAYDSQQVVWVTANRCLPDTNWRNSQRIRQYTQGHAETWGGVSLTIDSNVIDGPVADLQSKPIYGDGDSYEVDADFTQATSINTDGSRQTHSIHRAGDEDWVKFEATSGQRYVIETSNLRGDADTFIGLFWDNDGHPWLIESNDDGDSGLASRIEWTASSSGTFYVKIRDYNESHAGPNVAYDIQITATGPGSSDTQSNRAGVVVNSDRLNVRAGPGTSYTAIGHLTRNQRVEILARNSDSSWYQIAFSAGPGGFGWVYSTYIQTSASGLPVSDQTSSAPVSAPQAPSAALAAPSQQAQNAGNMNMGRYCQAKGFDEAGLTEQTAYGWHCRSSDGRKAGMDLEELCQQQHGSGYKPEYSNFNDPYSWQCISTGTAPAPSQPAQPAPQPQPQPSQIRTVTRYRVERQGEYLCGQGNIIALGFGASDSERRINGMITKCDSGKFRTSGRYYVLVDGNRVWEFTYGADHSFASFWIDPIAAGYSGSHTYQIQLYPDGQQEPIWSGVHRALDVEVQE